MKKLFASVLLGVAGLTACQEEEAVFVGSNTSIKAFEFKETKMTADVRIAQDSVFVTVPSETDLTKLVPVITVPSLAMITPASEVAQNFSQPVAYTVTAQNGKSQTYHVVVSLDTKASVKPLSTSRFHTGDTLMLDGVNLKGATLLLMRDSTEIKISSIATDAKKAIFVLPEDATLLPGSYRAEMMTGSEEAPRMAVGNIILLPEVPSFIAIGTNPISEQVRLTVIGKNFSAKGNQAFLVKDGISYFTNIKQEGANQIVITPRTVKTTGEYQVKVVTAEGQEIMSEETVQFYNTKVEIDSLSSTTFKQGEKMTLYGQNFTGAFNPQIKFVNLAPGGRTTTLPITVISSTMAEVTVTNLVSEGDYRIKVMQWVNTATYGTTVKVSAPDRVVTESK